MKIALITLTVGVCLWFGIDYVLKLKTKSLRKDLMKHGIHPTIRKNKEKEKK